MSLERVLEAVASALDQGSPLQDLRDQACAILLAALNGRSLPDFPPHESAVIADWVSAARQSADPVGTAYEQMLGCMLERKQNGLQIVRRRSVHRATGAYYTGEAVVQYMIGRARHYAPNARSAIDPACGSGAFLVAAERLFGAQLERLVGLDSDRTALGICQNRVPQAELRGLDALLEDAGDGFDLCLGNPPYISTGLRGSGAQDEKRLNALRSRYASTGQYKLNTYPMFIERGLQLVRPGGVLGYIVPDSFLTGRYFAGLRRLLLGHTILEVSLIRRNFWDHGLVGQSVILFVRKEPAPAGHQVGVRVCNSVEDLHSTPLVSLPLQEFVWGAQSRFRLVPDQETRAYLRQIESLPGARTFGSCLRTYSGLIGRLGQKSLLRTGNLQREGPWGPLLRSGREIDRYQLNWAGEEVCLDPQLIKSGGRLQYYRSPKLLMRQTADSLRAVYDDQGFYCLNNIHLLVPKGPEVNLRAILGLINSGTVNRIYAALTMEAGRLYPQVDLDLFADLPAPAFSIEEGVRLATLVKARQSAAPGEAARLDQEIDAFVEKRYGLN